MQTFNGYFEKEKMKTKLNRVDVDFDMEVVPHEVGRFVLYTEAEARIKELEEQIKKLKTFGKN